MKANFAYVGRGALNLILVLLIFVPLQLLIRGHVANSVAVVFLSLIVIATYLAGVRWIERRQPAEFLRIRSSELAAGFGLGIALFATVMLLLWAFGVYHPSGTGRVGGLTGGLVVAFFGATVEEILFRGFLFRLSAKLVGTAGALVFTSALFGAAHAANPGATVWSSAAIALEAGVLLGAAYALTNRLWLPIGLHVGWNFTEGSIFGMSVSGGNITSSLISGSLHGRDILTGGAFGPEASIVAVMVCLLASSVLLWRLIRLRRIGSPIEGDRARPVSSSHAS